MYLRVITPPVAIVTAAEAKAWAPVLANDDDARVDALLAAAQAQIEPPNSYLGRAFGQQTLELVLDGWYPSYPPCSPTRITLPAPPLIEVTGIVYVDADGAEQTLATTVYRVAGVGGRGMVILNDGQSWPTLRDNDPEAVRISFKAGYDLDDPQLLPAKQAVVLIATGLRGLSLQEANLRSETVEGIGSTSFDVSGAARGEVSGYVDGLLASYRVFG